MKISVHKIDNAYQNMAGLFPIDSEANDVFNKCRGEELIEVVKARNPKFHRKAFALFGLVLKNQDKYENMDDLLVEIKLQVGHYKEHITTGGKIIYVPQSIAFENMDDLEFSDFMSKAINVILKFLCVGMDRDILEEIVRF